MWNLKKNKSSVPKSGYYQSFVIQFETLSMSVSDMYLVKNHWSKVPQNLLEIKNKIKQKTVTDV